MIWTMLFVEPLFEGVLAHIDPGTGAMVLQALAGGALAALLFAKTIIRKIKSIFSKKSSDPTDPGSSDESE
jgi:hypothetical protein